MNTQPLVGDVTVQFVVHDISHMEAQLEVQRALQEDMCGYSLKLKSTRTQDIAHERSGQKMVEVFATFAPAPEA